MQPHVYPSDSLEQGSTVTACDGLVAYVTQLGGSADDLAVAEDEALCCATQAGRNRVESAD